MLSNEEKAVIKSQISGGYRYKKVIILDHGKCLVDVFVEKRKCDYIRHGGEVFFCLNGYKPFTMKLDGWRFKYDDGRVLRSIMGIDDFMKVFDYIYDSLLDGQKKIEQKIATACGE